MARHSLSGAPKGFEESVAPGGEVVKAAMFVDTCAVSAARIGSSGMYCSACWHERECALDLVFVGELLDVANGHRVRPDDPPVAGDGHAGEHRGSEKDHRRRNRDGRPAQERSDRAAPVGALPAVSSIACAQAVMSPSISCAD